ncbi:DUF4256 domain-containing protein [Undibacterium cyanobacteriorum]|uniref:DUF4256 domain-containing protein n=1 Tax=Undibacterium cyanobacteriorum TaxID=3073561 RepID=A0ABY9RGY3_9BURK|nr:DUF4256 domain-containing protein [Undibacterium sp. 20NA77.5]WMW80221.1 DUF4256 domain-containing protein [Undibacterium sp. 20NA77.5]
MDSIDVDMLQILSARFAKNPQRHVGLLWEHVEQSLRKAPAKLFILRAMEDTGGEPDVVGQHPETQQFVFCDCSAESPSGRRSLCYDRAALDARKENKPRGDALEMALAMQVEILTEQEYRHLQTLGKFDQKTSSWVLTPPAVRTLGGALFCDRRYEQVFVYHNGAESYYVARGFRARLMV